MRPPLCPALRTALTVCCAAWLAGCAGRPPLEDDRDTTVDARAADLDASPLTKPVLPPLVVPPHQVSAVAEQTLPAWPAVAFVARRPTARSLQRVIDEAMDKLRADPAVRDGVAGPAVLVYRGRGTDLDKSFDLEVGLAVRLGVTPKSAGVSVHALPPLRALAVNYFGPTGAIDRAYDQLLPVVQSGGRRPTGEVREVYADWDEADPAENEVLIAVGVEP